MVLARELAPAALDLRVAGVVANVERGVRVAAESLVGHQPLTLPRARHHANYDK
jgi:hypothetical protein